MLMYANDISVRLVQENELISLLELWLNKYKIKINIHKSNIAMFSK